MIEIWKDIENYNGLYKVSNLGRVKSLVYKKERILKQSKRKGYNQVYLCKNYIKETYRVHQLVAICFLNYKPSGYNGLFVDHINNIRTDNKVCNLQLVTNRKNCSKDRVGSSKYTGVSWSKQMNKWKAQIHFDGTTKHLGYFIKELDASDAYKNKLKTLEV